MQRIHPKPFATHLMLWGKREQLISSLQHKVSGEHPAPLSFRTSSFLLSSFCKRHVLTFCPFNTQPTAQQQNTRGHSSGRTPFLVSNVPSVVFSTLLLCLETPSIRATSCLAKSVLSAVLSNIFLLKSLFTWLLVVRDLPSVSVVHPVGESLLRSRPVV